MTATQQVCRLVAGVGTHTARWGVPPTGLAQWGGPALDSLHLRTWASSSSCCSNAPPLDSPTTSDSSPSTSSSPNNNSKVDADGYHVAYQGFFARPHKRLKIASLLNTFASFAAAPLIISYSSASPIARVAVTTSVIAFAVITTGGLHWFTSPYVHQLLYNTTTDTVKVQTLSFFGGSRWHEFPVSAVQVPNGYHPLASFKVMGKTFYVDKGTFTDAQLLARLVPPGSDGGPYGSEANSSSSSSSSQQE